MKKTKILFVCLFVCLLGGCGILQPFNKTKRKTKTTEIIKIDTLISIEPSKNIYDSILLEKILNLDTLKISSERFELKIFYDSTKTKENKKGTVKAIYKENKFLYPLVINKKVMTKEKENISSSKIYKITFKNKILILLFFICGFLLYKKFKK